MTTEISVRRWRQCIALVCALGVMLGAFGAHALKTRLDASEIALWQTAVSYLFWHALAAWGVLLLPRPSTRIAGLFLAGIMLFSGSLFALALGAPRWLGMVTPLGGLAWIVAWFALAWQAGRAES